MTVFLVDGTVGVPEDCLNMLHRYATHREPRVGAVAEAVKTNTIVKPGLGPLLHVMSGILVRASMQFTERYSY